MKEEKKKIEQERRKNYTKLYKSGVMGMILPAKEKFIIAAKYSRDPKLTDEEVAKIYQMAGFSEKVLSGTAINVKLNKAREKLDEIIGRYGSAEEVIEHFKTPAKRNEKINEEKQHCLIDELNLSDKVFDMLENLGLISTADIINNYNILLCVEDLDKKDLFEIVNAVHNKGLSFFKYDEERIKRDPELQKYQSIKCLNLSIRAEHCLRAFGISKLGQLTAMPEVSLPNIRLLGRKGTAEVIEKVHGLGMSFEGEPTLSSSDNMSANELLDRNRYLNDLNGVSQNFLELSEQEFKDLIGKYLKTSESNKKFLEELEMLKRDITLFQEAVQEEVAQGAHVKRK